MTRKKHAFGGPKFHHLRDRLAAALADARTVVPAARGRRAIAVAAVVVFYKC